MTGREGTLGREQESRTVGIEGGLNTLARRKRDVKLQEDPRPRLTTTLEILPFVSSCKWERARVLEIARVISGG